MSETSLREQAINIWQAGVDAVNSQRVVENQIALHDGKLSICGDIWTPQSDSHICVVGAGKAGAGMARGVEAALGQAYGNQLSGWVNVPEDCVEDLAHIYLHGARPAGVNEPTQAGVDGTQEILKQVSSLSENDLCIVLISGGGSALLPAPVAGISLADKLAVTRHLMHSGADIEQLNTVRRALSAVKGGGLLRACTAGKLVALIISDVIGSPLETIASGPTCLPTTSDAEAPYQVLEKFDPKHTLPQSVWDVVQEHSSSFDAASVCDHSNHIIASNETAVVAAAEKAHELGFEIRSSEYDEAGIACEIGEQLASQISIEKQNATAPVCLISGGEPIVQLAKTDQPRKGGRNQEVALAAANYLWSRDHDRIVVLSGGTDGEDGPTNSAGAFVDAEVIDTARQLDLNPEQFLAINNSYPFFEQAGGLLITGPTHTNVMDLRIALARP